MPQRGRTQRGRQERPPPQPQGTRGGCWAGTSARASGAGAGPGCAAPSRNSAASSGPRRGRAGREAEESGKVTRARGGAGVAWQRGRHGRRGGDPTAGGLEAEPEAGHRLLERWFPRVPAKSVVALKTPIRVELVAGKSYRWCVCGRSKKQVERPWLQNCQSLPFCDGSHFFQRTGLSPLKFKAQETRIVALCTCKATQKPPYCDGTHRSERVQKTEVGSPL
ncbi:CDGSH iron-sulfur domain-containing protein 3, mitochondrial [Manis pentadactyla]|uniref:CDGSH iron-sulfur domain-containing protein 3, mitochondrial n=1 Tax=Manis pentadactyla TaxID=143292 RepID=UPI00255C88D7|nr:CDGSH iron-sulfur domain-containing protein 3, mitochondrial [Manis pentadactyla]